MTFALFKNYIITNNVDAIEFKNLIQNNSEIYNTYIRILDISKRECISLYEAYIYLQKESLKNMNWGPVNLKNNTSFGYSTGSAACWDGYGYHFGRSIHDSVYA